jgi:hypothetical protein
MNWLSGIAGRNNLARKDEDSQMVDYSYVFGTQKGGERYDPHIQKQAPGSSTDMQQISRLIRKRESEKTD